MAIDIDEWVTGRAITLLEEMNQAQPIALGVNIVARPCRGIVSPSSSKPTWQAPASPASC